MMNKNTDTWFPERWIVVRIVSIKDNNQVFYRLLCGWHGGYLDGAFWRINSGITKVEDGGDYWTVFGRSGSVYRCHKESYGFSTLTFNKYTRWQEYLGEENFQMMPENTDWLNVDWGLKND